MTRIATATKTPKVDQAAALKMGREEIIPASKLPRNLKFDFNCRAPSRGSKAYKDMIHTLETEPQKFNAWNCGIHIANNVEVLDGGHTSLAIWDARDKGFDLNGVLVRVFWYDDLKPHEMAEKSKFLNNKVTPLLRGEKDVMGDWDSLKAHLDGKYLELFEFKPNTKQGALKVDKLVGMLNALTADTGERSYSGPTALVRLYKDGTKYQKFLKRINDAIDLYSVIALDLATDKKVLAIDGTKQGRTMKLPDGKVAPNYVPDAYIWPVFSAFSLQLDENGDWKTDPQKLWKNVKTKMVSQLNKEARARNSDPTKVGKSREVYLALQRSVLTR